MKEIKYRCWHNNKIEKVHSLHLNSKKAIISYSGGGNYSVPFDEIILMEYIGRKDVNNVEIYEGDIVEFPADEILSVVRYNEERNAFVLDDYGISGALMEYGYDEDAGEFGVVDTNGFDDFYSIDDIRVVGNIYENKDLITRSNKSLIGGMMREILFKAKGLDNDEWIEGGFCQSTNGRTFLIGVSQRGYIDGLEVIPKTVCQYTGLIDKNGDNIWENDIVKLDDDFYIVTWEEDDAMFALEDVGLIESFKNVDSKWCEVVGNIIDSPEFFNE